MTRTVISSQTAPGTVAAPQTAMPQQTATQQPYPQQVRNPAGVNPASVPAGATWVRSPSPGPAGAVRTSVAYGPPTAGPALMPPGATQQQLQTIANVPPGVRMEPAATYCKR